MIAESPSFKADFDRGNWDIPFFAKRFLDVNLHPGQIRFANTVRARTPSLWRAAYLTICLSAGNRAGKTLILAIVLLHSMIYKIGMQPPKGTARDQERWLKAEYIAFHFAIRQEVADLVYWELVKLLSGVHEAQKSGVGCPLVNDIPNAATWDRKYLGEYRWFVLNPMLGGAELHFRTSVEKAMSTLGRNMHLISFDECGFEPNLEMIVNEVLHLRRLQTGGQLLLISTPTEGITIFSDYWEAGNPEAPDRAPGRMSVRMSTRENVGYGLDRTTFDRLVEDMDPDLIPQNIDGYFIEGRESYFNARVVDDAFVTDLPELQPAKHLHQYVQGVDAGLKDATWAIVLDCTDQNRVVGVKAVRERFRQTTDTMIALTADNHNAYTSTRPDLRASCATAFDATGWGGKMFKEMLGGITPLRAIEFGGSRQKKLKLLGDLKTMLDTGKLVMPRSGLWLQVRRQLSKYKLADSKIEQDAVMALACAVAEVRRTPPISSTPVNFDYFAGDTGTPRKTSFWDN